MRIGNNPPVGFSAQTASFPQPRFGRDAIFERNDRFDSMQAQDKTQKATLETLLKSLGKPVNFNIERLLTAIFDKRPAKSAAYRQSAQQVAEASQFLYDTSGRIRGKKWLDLALQAADLEYQLISGSPDATPVEKALVGVKYANARIAQPDADDDAFKLLEKSLQTLEKAGYTGKAPQYIHGLYNRGAYFMNNDIYFETAKNTGPQGMKRQEAGHEGLGLHLDDDSEILKSGIPRLKEDLSYLQKAAKLAPAIADDQVAQIEYMSAQGELLHVLSHINYQDYRNNWDRQALLTFKQALDTLEAVPDDRKNPKHVKLLEKLGTVKIPHMCGHRHRPTGAGQTCAAADNYTALAMRTLQSKAPPQTDAEKALHDDDPMADLASMLEALMGGRGKMIVMRGRGFRR